MATVTCPRCGAQASGSFCSSCGASLEARPCPSCGAVPEPGARFCNLCGTALTGVPGAPAPRPPPAGRAARPAAKRAAPASAPVVVADGSRLGWWVAGAALVGLILIVALPIVRREGGAPEGGAPVTGAGPGAVDLSSMTPRQAADRLFDRVMTAESAGDTGQVNTFVPMAISAYEQARPLDLDGLFHLSLLRRTAGDAAAALATAREALEQDPDHLLNLAAAAEAALAQGDSATAREHYGRFLEVYDRERAEGLTEYEAHARLFEDLRASAVRVTGGG